MKCPYFLLLKIMKEQTPIFSECNICKLWSSDNKPYKTGHLCTKHYDQQMDKDKSKNSDKKFQDFVTNVQNMNASIDDSVENTDNL